MWLFPYRQQRVVKNGYNKATQQTPRGGWLPPQNETRLLYNVTKKWYVDDALFRPVFMLARGGGLLRFSWYCSYSRGNFCQDDLQRMHSLKCILTARPTPVGFVLSSTWLRRFQGAGLRNTSVTLMLYWDHMPLTGTLFQHSVAVDTFECPGNYARR